ncbi:MAG: Rpn family recombination-promoting nuclease/putative transposase, partial [Peptoanaerobacter stomatis]
KESDIESRLHDSYALGEQVGEQRGIQIGEQRGIQIGEQRGIQMGSISTARNLLNMNIDIDTIIKATNLDRNIIIDLQNGKL